MNPLPPWVFLAQLSPLSVFMEAYQHSGGMGRLIVLVLFFGSIGVWSIMLGKRAELVCMAANARHFLDAYRKTRRPLELFRTRSVCADSPVQTIYRAAAEVLSRLRDPAAEDLESPDTDPEGIDDEELGLVRGMAERVLSEQSLRVEKRMSTLATATTTAPFLGLLGTVWGVMEAFQAMSGSGMVLLSEVAPGISGALVTTVMGLVVALVSSIGYNYLTDRVRALQVQMENFTDEFIAEVLRHYRLRGRRSRG